MESNTVVEKPAVPIWVTEMPEHEQTTYHLGHVSVGGELLEDVVLTREEFAILKRHAAALRGLHVEPEAEPAALKAEGEDELEGARKTVSGKLIVNSLDLINSRICHKAKYAFEQQESDPALALQLMAEVSLLGRIVEEWDSDYGVDSYPDDLPLVAAIRCYLDL